MADYQGLVEQARKLGSVIAEHPRVRAFLAAQKGVHDDREAMRLLNDYQSTSDRVQMLEAEGKPIEAEDKRKLAECERGMASVPALKSLMRAQADYIEMMNAINDAMSEGIARSQPGAGAAKA